MFNQSFPSSQLLFSTVRIEASLPEGRTSVGSSFFFDFSVDDQRRVPVLVTNKHVVTNAARGTFFVHEATLDPQAGRAAAPSSVNVILDDFGARWIRHPDNVDLCAMPFEPLRPSSPHQRHLLVEAGVAPLCPREGHAPRPHLGAAHPASTAAPRRLPADSIAEAARDGSIPR